MDKEFLINILSRINAHNLVTFKSDFEEFFAAKLKELGEIAQYDLTTEINDLHIDDDESLRWRYIASNFYLLFSLNEILNETKDILSVRETKVINSVFVNLIVLGITHNLQPNLPYYRNSPHSKTKSVTETYNCLTRTVNTLNRSLKCFYLRSFVLQNLRYLLIALYQVVYCPLKKPSNDNDFTGFVMTKTVYEKLLQDQGIFKTELEALGREVPKPIYVRETMLLVQADSPAWFKKVVTATLNSIITSEKGLECVVSTILDGASNDSTITWNIMNVIAKLVRGCNKLPNYRDKIFKQVTNLLNIKSTVYDRVYISCAKTLYLEDNDSLLIEHLFSSFSCFIDKDDICKDCDVTANIQHTIELMNMCFTESPPLPTRLLNPILYVIFKVYLATNNTTFVTLNQNLKDLILLYLDEASVQQNYLHFDSLIFGFNANFNNDLYFQVNSNTINVKHSSYVLLHPLEESGNALYQLLQKKTKLAITLFKYLLKCLIDNEKYFKADTNHELLCVNEDVAVNEVLKRKILVYKMLSELAEDKRIQKYLNENPDDVIKYMGSLFTKCIENKTHIISNEEFDNFQSLFTVVMVLQALVSYNNDSQQFQSLTEPLTIICNETVNKELKELVEEILKCINNNKTSDSKCKLSELEKAIEDICDPLLPVRGHGLMTLTKLVQKKDENVMGRKQYILNIFQQNLKNEDSFIYLNAINGLAALANIFPDVVISVLAEEFGDYSREDDVGHEVRMKLGEVLVRVTKSLGELAPKYKTLLLNTFLVGTKDDDHLIRASSLSNLGEVCRVLGYKLGTIVSEVLECVHAIITTDKAAEPRRAAVTVLRQLFVGLESEMITFLKDEILTIYRSLKHIYNNDPDDVMRLQAQLALEELNENVKNFVLSSPELNLEKKINMLS